MTTSSKEVTVVLVLFNTFDDFLRRTVTLDAEKDNFDIGRCSKVESKQLLPAKTNAWFDSRVVSRKHSNISVSVEKKKVYIIDTGSMHGTFLNGTKLVQGKKTALAHHDILTLGAKVSRGSEFFEPLKLRVELTWHDDIPAVPAPKIQSAPSNSFVVPDDDDDEDDVNEDSIANLSDDDKHSHGEHNNNDNSDNIDPDNGNDDDVLIIDSRSRSKQDETINSTSEAIPKNFSADNNVDTTASYSTGDKSGPFSQSPSLDGAEDPVSHTPVSPASSSFRRGNSHSSFPSMRKPSCCSDYSPITRPEDPTSDSENPPDVLSAFDFPEAEDGDCHFAFDPNCVDNNQSSSHQGTKCSVSSVTWEPGFHGDNTVPPTGVSANGAHDSRIPASTKRNPEPLEDLRSFDTQQLELPKPDFAGAQSHNVTNSGPATRNLPSICTLTQNKTIPERSVPRGTDFIRPYSLYPYWPAQNYSDNSGYGNVSNHVRLDNVGYTDGPFTSQTPAFSPSNEQGTVYHPLSFVGGRTTGFPEYSASNNNESVENHYGGSSLGSSTNVGKFPTKKPESTGLRDSSFPIPGDIGSERIRSASLDGTQRSPAAKELSTSATITQLNNKSADFLESRGTKRKAEEPQQKVPLSGVTPTNSEEPPASSAITPPPEEELAAQDSVLDTATKGPKVTLHSEPEHSRKRVKVSHPVQSRNNIARTVTQYAATAFAGAVVGGVGVIAALASLPPDYFS